ncbi:hypothetical protein BTVI_24228 [Pitangus sulphuratus]|nr:hypothetical protein BTVI_24228 [Pitangus sulphuratus]
MPASTRMGFLPLAKAKPIRSDRIIPMCLRVSPKCFLNSVSLGAVEAEDHFPGEWSVPNHPLGEESFSNIQPKPPLAQLQAIPLGPVIGHLREEISACPSPSPHKEVVDLNEVSPQSPPG